jgi:hypothetical protein
LAFFPEQVSIINFLVYLQLSGKHGLDLGELVKNLGYLLIIIAPLFYIGICDFRSGAKFPRVLLVLTAIEGCAAVIGSKPGAGTYHLMPFIPTNAFLLQRLLEEKRPSTLFLAPFKIGLLALALASTLVLLQLVWSMYQTYSDKYGEKKEIAELADSYAGLVLGVSDNQRYSYAFFRPMLESRGVRQIDYPAYMDLNFSGVSDGGFAQALSECKFSYMALPKLGEPFSMLSFYTNKPLLSDNVRAMFKEHYKMLEERNYYSVFNCRK